MRQLDGVHLANAQTAVSYRPGARFGPHAIRTGSRRVGPARSFLYPWGFSIGQDSELDIVSCTTCPSADLQIDCNDVPVSPYDNALAIDEMQVAYQTLINRPTTSKKTKYTSGLAKDGEEHPRILTLGGDHTIVLPILGALHSVYGPISVLHFDAHLDTWNGNELGGAHTEQHKVVSLDRSSVEGRFPSLTCQTHGTFFWKAHELGYINNRTSAHAGIRTRLSVSFPSGPLGPRFADPLPSRSATSSTTRLWASRSSRPTTLTTWVPRASPRPSSAVSATRRATSALTLTPSTRGSPSGPSPSSTP